MAKFEIYSVRETDDSEPSYRWRLVNDHGVTVASDGHPMAALSAVESRLRVRQAVLAMQTADIATELTPAGTIGEVEEEALRNDQ